MTVEVLTYDRQEANIVVFRARDTETGKPVLIAVDHRQGQDIVNAMAATTDPVYAEVEPWQVL